MKSRKTSVFVVLLALGLAPQARAQITQPAEYAKYVGHSNVVEASADFGDQVNLRDGKVVFRATDIELPGIGPTIRITRSFDPNGLGTYFHESSGNAFGAWELELPRIATITANALGVSTYSPVGWQVTGATTAQKNARCTGFSAPPRVSFPSDTARGWDAHEWWSGYHLVDESGNAQSVMTRADSSVRSDMPLMTSGNWLISCLSATSSGEPGEAFLAVSPDGTKYRLDYLVYTEADTLEKPLWSGSGSFSASSSGAGITKGGTPTPMKMPEQDQLERRYAAMLVTRVEDRFGNWVTYHYTNGRVDSIDASDGRHVGLAYPAANSATVTVGSGAGARTWSYAYTTGSPSAAGALQQLTVTRPDGSTWQYALNWQTAPDLSVGDMEGTPTCPFDTVETNPYVDQVVTSPQGATLTMRVTRRRFGRSYVPKDCFNSRPDIPGSGIMKYPREWFAYAVTSRTVSGPGMATATWNYSYAPAVSSWLQDCPTPTSCPSTVWTDITRPDGSRQRSIFSNKFDATENKLLREEDYASGGALLRATDYTYATVLRADWLSNPYPWPVSVGDDQQTRQNPETSGQWAPVRQTVVTQQGKTFTWQVPTVCGTGSSPCFDRYARPTRMVKNSGDAVSNPAPASGNFGKTEAVAYYDNTTLWALGQTASVTCADNTASPKDPACDGDVVSATTFDATTALPLTSSAFGKLQATATYNTNGTLATLKDGNNRTTTYASWKRGIPQSIQFADATTRSATVDDNGWITSVTDETGALTCYGYDAMGRISSITYPSEASAGVCNTSTWAATLRSFVRVASAEYGIGAGHWRETVTTGNGTKVTYYDGQWRPKLVREYDAAAASATERFTATSYDAEGRVAFASYPSTSSAPTTGVHTLYDGLGRPTSVIQDSELGTLTTSTVYGNGFTTTVTDARGNATTTAYQAYDRPTTDWPAIVAQPAGVYTHIARDPFGKPRQIRRSNSVSPTGGTGIDRSYAYNAYQELCRVVEPETGATLMGYYGAGNLKWSASGLPASQACETDGTSTAVAARRVDRTYDYRNRISTLAFPDLNGNQTWTYTPDGLSDTVTTYNDAGASTVVNAYTYNKRRLLIGESQVQTGNTDAWSIGYGYDANAAPASLVYPTGLTVTYLPNALGQPTQVASSTQTFASAIAYFPNGALKQFTYGNGIVHTLTQNARGLPDRSRDMNGSTAIHDDSYDYDQVGNVAAISDAVTGNRGNRDMAYDALNRLTSTTSPMFGTASYTYDVLDNLTHVQVTAGSQARNQDYCYDGANRLTNLKTGGCGGTSVIGLGYDVQGNLNNKNGVLYGFDYGNRLRSGGPETYRYDAYGRRVRSINATGGILYSLYGQGGQLLWQRDQRTSQRRNYVYLQGSLLAEHRRPIGSTTETIVYQHTDALGTPVATTDSAKTVLQRSEYEPYGYLLNRAMEDGPGYTAHATDAATGLVYMQQRYYDPVIGAFLSTDAVSVDGTTGWNFCRYCYAANNPYRFKDPDGRIIDTLVDAAFTIYDTGRLLGAAAAYGAGKISGNEALTNAGWEGVKETSGAVAVDAVAAAVPFVSVPMVKTGEHAVEAARAAEKAAQGPRLARGKLREQVLDKGRQADGSVACKYCGKPTATTSDHVVPYSKGGATKIDNLEPACTSCNSSKGNKELGKDWIPPKDREQQ